MERANKESYKDRDRGVPSAKKDKDAAAPEVGECANCCAKNGKNGIVLRSCTRCQLTEYCGRPCQAAHWRAFHKQFCLTPEERVPQDPGVAQAARSKDSDKKDECIVCFDSLASGNLCTLPCTHTFHAACVEKLRSFGVKQECPMCRVELPPGPDQLCEEASRRCDDMERRVDRGEASWGALTKAQQREMDEVLRLWRSASNDMPQRSSTSATCTTTAKACSRIAPRHCAGCARRPSKDT